MERAPALPVGTLATDTGYFDQSHAWFLLTLVPLTYVGNRLARAV